MLSPGSTKPLILLISLLLLVSGLYLGYTNYFVDPVKPSTVEYVQSSNMNFKDGYALLSKGDFKNSAELFEMALSSAQDTKQEAYIKTFAGYARGLAGDYKKGIEILKSVADNELYADTHRAYAVEFMGEIYYWSVKNPEVTSLIFNSMPYKGFWENGDVEASYVNLYKYGQSLFPTGAGSYRLAMADFYTKSSSTVTSLKAGISALTDELVILRGLGVNDGIFLSNKYLNIANLQSLLSVKEPEQSAKAEDSFKISLRLAPVGSSQYISVSYYYALFLSQKFGQDRSEDIAKLLSPFYDPVYKNTPFYSFFLIAENKENERVRRNLQFIGDVDEQFRRQMESLGWKI